MYEQLRYMMALFMLAYLAMQDIKRKEVSLLVLVISGCAALLFLAVGGYLTIIGIAGRILPGILMMTLSLTLKESIGYGDGATILVLGLWTSMNCSIRVTMVAIMLTGVYGMFLWIGKRRKQRIPFVPFLLVAMEVFLIDV